MGVGVSGFETAAYQLGLWDIEAEPDHCLQDTLDELRDRFGDQAIQRDSQLKREDTFDKGAKIMTSRCEWAGSDPLYIVYELIIVTGT